MTRHDMEATVPLIHRSVTITHAYNLLVRMQESLNAYCVEQATDVLMVSGHT
jgi:hypothetical protein